MDWDKTPIRDVHEVAGLVKAYFRELSEPLVPTSMMKEFVSVGANGMWKRGWLCFEGGVRCKY